MQPCGHTVLLVPPQYVKPFVKRGKNDRADAEALCETAGRPTMQFVQVRSSEHQANAMILGVCEQLVGQRTALINALRGHATEFGVIPARGTSNVEALMEKIARETSIPPATVRILTVLHDQLVQLDTRIVALEGELRASAAKDETARRRMKAPGLGPITALSLSLTIEAKRFESGRHFAAWLGLVPSQNSTGGRTRLGRISRAGHERVRQLLVVGATTVIRHARPDRPQSSTWILQLLQRRPRKVVAVAVANKMARIVWAMMARGEAYRPMPVA